jgi:hypothetical protein
MYFYIHLVMFGKVIRCVYKSYTLERHFIMNLH